MVDIINTKVPQKSTQIKASELRNNFIATDNILQGFSILLSPNNNTKSQALEVRTANVSVDLANGVTKLGQFNDILDFSVPGRSLRPILNLDPFNDEGSFIETDVGIRRFRKVVIALQIDKSLTASTPLQTIILQREVIHPSNPIDLSRTATINTYNSGGRTVILLSKGLGALSAPLGQYTINIQSGDNAGISKTIYSTATSVTTNDLITLEGPVLPFNDVNTFKIQASSSITATMPALNQVQLNVGPASMSEPLVRYRLEVVTGINTGAIRKITVVGGVGNSLLTLDQNLTNDSNFRVRITKLNDKLTKNDAADFSNLATLGLDNAIPIAALIVQANHQGSDKTPYIEEFTLSEVIDLRQLVTISGEINDLAEQNAFDIARIEGILTTVQDDITTIQSNLATAQSDIAVLQGDVITLTGQIPTASQIAAMAGGGAFGTPGASNKFLTQDFYTGTIVPLLPPPGSLLTTDEQDAISRVVVSPFGTPNIGNKFLTQSYFTAAISPYIAASTGQVAALAGTLNAPSNTNRYVTNDDKVANIDVPIVNLQAQVDALAYNMAPISSLMAEQTTTSVLPTYVVKLQEWRKVTPLTSYKLRIVGQMKASGGPAETAYIQGRATSEDGTSTIAGSTIGTTTNSNAYGTFFDTLGGAFTSPANGIITIVYEVATSNVASTTSTRYFCAYLELA